MYDIKSSNYIIKSFSFYPEPLEPSPLYIDTCSNNHTLEFIIIIKKIIKQNILTK